MSITTAAAVFFVFLVLPIFLYELTINNDE